MSILAFNREARRCWAAAIDPIDHEAALRHRARELGRQFSFVFVQQDSHG